MLSVQNKLDLSSIAQMAYGHGSTSEGVKGGEGRIGLIDGRPTPNSTLLKWVAHRRKRSPHHSQRLR